MRAPSLVRIAIAESNVMTCESLAGSLGRISEIEVVCTATSAREFAAAARRHNPDVALVSAQLQEGPLSGFSVLRLLRDGPAAVRPVMLADAPEREFVLAAFRSGARGVFRRSDPLSLLTRCITAVHQGQIWAGSIELQYVLEALAHSAPFRCLDARGKELLTQREQQLLPLIAEGLTNAEIAARLRLSVHTVKNHLFRIYEKLGISTRVELVLYALSSNLRPAASSG